MGVEQFLGLAAACVLLIVVPGPSVLFLVGRALAHGRDTALASMLGNSLGSYLAAVGVALGVGPLLQASDVLFHAVRLAGAAYLVWLGVQAFRHARVTGPLHPAGREAAPSRPAGRRASVRAGVLVGVTNPKTFIIFAAILPPFVDRAAGNVPAQMLLLGLVPVVIGLVTDTVWVLLASRARSWLGSSPRRAVAVGRVGGLSMVGLGMAVAADGRTSH